MTADLLVSYLDDLDVLLEGLHQLQVAKQTALAKMETARLETIAQEELALTKRLAAVQSSREQLAKSAGGMDAAGAVGELIERLDEPDRTRLRERLARVTALARTVQDEASSNWLAAYRTQHHVADLLAIIAGAGRPATGRGGQGQGLMLDSHA